MYYIYDKTQKEVNGTPVIIFKQTSDLIVHLEKICPKLLGKTRAQLMSDAADFGFGDDDREGRSFYQFVSEYLEMGVVRKNGKTVRCNIFTSSEFDAPEYGD